MRRTQQWIYFVQYDVGGPIKIGSAVDVQKRLEQLQSGAAAPLFLLAAIPGGMTEEKALHRKLAKHRLRGEWFQPTDDVLDLVQEAAQISPSQFRSVAPKTDRRCPPDEACAHWTDSTIDVKTALSRMSGWTFNQAYRQFGPRGVHKWLPGDRARAMARSRWAKAEPGVVDLWRSPAMDAERKRWGSHWRDPVYPNAQAAFDAFPEELQQQFGSVTTARRIFKHRRPGDPSAGGRPPKTKRKR